MLKDVTDINTVLILITKVKAQNNMLVEDLKLANLDLDISTYSIEDKFKEAE